MILVLLACLEPSPEEVQAPLSFVGSPSVVEVQGKTLQLDEAKLRINAVYLEAPVEVAWSIFPTAMAHPGHSFAGDVRGEFLGERVIDLLVDTELGEVVGYEGQLASASVSLDGAVEVLGAVDGVPVELEFSVVQVVGGIPLDVDWGEATDALSLRFDLEEALSSSELKDTDGDGRVTVADGVLTNTLGFGFSSTAAWSLQLE